MPPQLTHYFPMPTLDLDTFKLLLLKRKRAEARLAKAQEPTERNEVTQESAPPCGARKSTKQKTRPAKKAKANEAEAKAEKMEEDQPPKPPLKSRAELVAERDSLGAEREQVAASLAGQQAQLEEVQDRLEQLNDKKHALVIKLKHVRHACLKTMR